MNILRNIFNTSTRTISYLRQNGQNALLNFTQQPIDGITTTSANFDSSTKSTGLQSLTTTKPAIIPKSILDAATFKGKKFNGIQRRSLSPTTLKRLRRMHQNGMVELVFLCKICNQRNTKEVSEAAYRSGIVILQCDFCNVDHLICDNLGWFADASAKDMKDFDQILAERAGQRRVKVVKVNEHGELI